MNTSHSIKTFYVPAQVRIRIITIQNTDYELQIDRRQTKYTCSRSKPNSEGFCFWNIDFETEYPESSPSFSSIPPHDFRGNNVKRVTKTRFKSYLSRSLTVNMFRLTLRLKNVALEQHSIWPKKKPPTYFTFPEIFTKHVFDVILVLTHVCKTFKPWP